MIVTHPTSLIKAVEQATTATDLIAAVQALAEARLEVGIPTLIAVLGYNNPAAAVIAVNGLVQLGKVAVSPLLELIDDYNYGARAYSIRALAAIADPAALTVLLNAAATDFAPSVRRAAAKGLGGLRWSQLPPEQVYPAQAQALEILLSVAEDADWAIRYAAVVGLQALATSKLFTHDPLATQVSAKLDRIVQTEPDLSVKARAQLAQQLLGRGMGSQLEQPSEGGSA